MINMKTLDCRITSDSRQIIVNKARRDDKGDIIFLEDKKTGEKYESQSLVGYYGNLSKAMVGIKRDYTLSDGVVINTLEDYANALDDIERRLESDLNIKERF